jgi:hypothetical protein
VVKGARPLLVYDYFQPAEKGARKLPRNFVNKFVMFCAVLCRSPVCFSRHQSLAPFFDVNKIAAAKRRCHRHRTSNQPKICAGTKIVPVCAGLCRFVRFVPQSHFVFGPTVTCPLFLTDENNRGQK